MQARFVPTNPGAESRIENRVPTVDVAFWLIKLMAVTVGGTVADFLIFNLGLGPTGTTWIMAAVLFVALVLQLMQGRYVPLTYWITAVFAGVVGALIASSLVDTMGYQIWIIATFFTIALGVTLLAWYMVEGGLSIRTICTTRHELFYWIAILLTFALGTAAGNLVAEAFDVGYLATGIIFGALISAVVFAYCVFELNGTLAFWLAYILTGPFGSSCGGWLAQPMRNGGLGLGTLSTSLVFGITIVILLLHSTAAHSPIQTRSHGS